MRNQPEWLRVAISALVLSACTDDPPAQVADTPAAANLDGGSVDGHPNIADMGRDQVLSADQAADLPKDRIPPMDAALGKGTSTRDVGDAASHLDGQGTYDISPSSDGGHTSGDPFACLDPNEGELIIRISRGGTDVLDIKSERGLNCQSRFLPARGESSGELSLFWSDESGALTIIVRSEGIAPGKTGIFPASVVLISQSNRSWSARPGECQLAIDASVSVGGNSVGIGPGYKVSGRLNCSWQLEDSLEAFEFLTRVPGY